MKQTVQKKENRRIRYTRLALRESLLAQLEEKPLNKISVSQVCDQADVNRSTFYLYYKDVYDLNDQIQQELYDEIYKLVSQDIDLVPGITLLRRIYELIYKNRDLARVVFGKYADKEFMKKISNIYRDQAIKDWSKEAKSVNAETLSYLYTYLTYTNLGMVEHWISTDFRETPEQLARMTSDMISYGASSIIRKE